MNINLANIDFVPGQGGGGEAVIRSLDVTENGTYSAPSGVDGYNPVNVNVSGGGSLTPEEQKVLDTLVDSSEGVLYTNTYERYVQDSISLSDSVQSNSLSSVFWDDLYLINSNTLYKVNRKSYQLDEINHFENMWPGQSFFADKTGRLYCDGYELDLENGTMSQNQINIPDYSRYNSLQNIFYGEYGVWVLGFNAYKFNESTQVFEQMQLNNTFSYSGEDTYNDLFRYEGHILGVYNSLVFEITEYEDHINVTDVTGVYFNMPEFYIGNYCCKSTKDGGLYYISGNFFSMYDKSLGKWVNIDGVINQPIEGLTTLVSDNIMYSISGGNVYYMNLGPEFSNTSWTKISNVAVDLKSDQKIKGIKKFKDNVVFDSPISAYDIYSSSEKDIRINANKNNLQNIGNKITFNNYYNKETILKNGTKNIATVDQTFINSTFRPYGTDGDNIGYVNGFYTQFFNFNTYTNRMFKKYDNNWYEFNGTSTLIPVSFEFDVNTDFVYNSPSATITFNDKGGGTYNTYMWNNENTRWNLICSSNVSGGNIWFDGENFRSRNTYKLVETEGVWSWIEDPLVNDIWQDTYKFVYKGGEVYAYSNDDWHLYKYNKVDCTLDKIGFLNYGKIYAFFNEMFFQIGDNNVHIIDLSKVDPQNPDQSLIGEFLFHTTNNINSIIGATDRLWYYTNSSEMCSSYQYIYEKPAVPASDGTYTLKAVRVGDQITYNWVLDA